MVGGPSASTEELHLAATVARRYYLDRISRVEIAQEFGISRFKVARLIERAHAEGLVRIEITDPLGVSPDLSAALKDALHLRNAFVVDVGTQTRTQVGAMAARYLAEIVRPDGRVGIAWSRSTQALVEHLRGLPPCRFIQLCGVIPRAAEEEQNVELVRQAARAVGGTATTFYSPFVVADAPTAIALRRQPGISDALRACDHLDVAVITVGQWMRGESTVHDALSEEDQVSFRRRGALAESCGILLDARGRALRHGLQRRVVAVTEAQLRTAGEIVVLATEEVRAPAVHALVRSGLGHTLITHRSFAERLLLTRGHG